MIVLFITTAGRTLNPTVTPAADGSSKINRSPLMCQIRLAVAKLFLVVLYEAEPSAMYGGHA
jgi:hypothetical protein